MSEHWLGIVVGTPALRRGAARHRLLPPGRRAAAFRLARSCSLRQNRRVPGHQRLCVCSRSGQVSSVLKRVAGVSGTVWGGPRFGTGARTRTPNLPSGVEAGAGAVFDKEPPIVKGLGIPSLRPSTEASKEALCVGSCRHGGGWFSMGMHGGKPPPATLLIGSSAPSEVWQVAGRQRASPSSTVTTRSDRQTRCSDFSMGMHPGKPPHARLLIDSSRRSEVSRMTACQDANPT